MPQIWTRFLSAARLVTGLPRASTEEREMIEEMQFHIDRETERLQKSGLSAADAGRAARVAFGGTAQWSEAARDEFRSRPLEEFGRDVRYAFRSLAHTPTFTAAVVLTLAVGIGATSTVYTVTERVVLRPLGYGDGGELAMLWSPTRTNPTQQAVNSFPDYVDWTTNNPDIQYASIFNIWTPTLTGVADPEPLVGSRVSADFFRTLGVRPMLGRDFRPDEDVFGGPNVVMISASLWRRRFNGDSAVVGRQIRISDVPYTVIGVLPPNFRNPEPFFDGTAEVWRPLSLNDGAKIRLAHFLRVIVRLKQGVTVDKAQRDFSVIATRLAAAYPASNANHAILLVPMHEQVVGQSRTILFAVLGAAFCLLLIVCGNVASLVLTRHANREPELALRSALGAARGRVTRMLFAESVVLGVAGGTLGLGVCIIATAVLRRIAPPDLPRIDEITVDGWAVAVTALVSIGSAVLFGLVPAMRSARLGVNAGLQQSSARTTGRGAGRGLIVVAELALSVMLLASAGLLTRSLLRLNATPIGLDTNGLLTFRVNLPGTRYRGDSAYAQFFANLQERLSRRPGIVGAVTASYLPLTGLNDMALLVGGAEQSPSAAGVNTHARSVSPGYFAMLHIPITGREFTDNDSRHAPPVVIINRTAADNFFPGQNPIGQRFLRSPKDSAPATVVGVVADVRFYGPASQPEREMFQPHAQAPWQSDAIIVRTAGAPMTALAAVRETLHELDANLPVVDAAPMGDHLRSFSARQRFYATVFGLFGVTALILSAIGVYGLIAYGVVQRRREMAIRMALGAQTGDVLGRFVGRAAVLIAWGVVLGAAGALAVGRTLSSLLFEITPTDATTLIMASGSLAIIALIASVVPAMAARRVSLASTLRS